MRAACAVLSVVALTACAPGATGGGSTRLAGLTLVPAPGGLDVAGSGGREIGFGRDRPGVLDTVARIEGVAPRPVPCGSGRDAYATAGGLRLVFRGRTFVGWDSVSDRAGLSCA
ncbi:hypothetical protein [Jannaschia rubra]|uniref:Uncharacterized protein n=1 Tax=Jannaschia rubra TaxID=282197 RepID=A0A0M6XR11_9RHOB|nr:hypothetical protein [Jannaschia rubra]CTQ32454.1 hypothetical protein JAN5088_01225 [Jannaschia rubra]SFF82570.1 hypothetical protein SAMN04488517_101389 [Jannaschia rubra]